MFSFLDNWLIQFICQKNEVKFHIGKLKQLVHQSKITKYYKPSFTTLFLRYWELQRNTMSYISLFLYSLSVFPPLFSNPLFVAVSSPFIGIFPSFILLAGLSLAGSFGDIFPFFYWFPPVFILKQDFWGGGGCLYYSGYPICI